MSTFHLEGEFAYMKSNQKYSRISNYNSYDKTEDCRKVCALYIKLNNKSNNPFQEFQKFKRPIV